MEKEGRKTEYKLTLENYRSLCKTVVAFANDIGGIIIVGVHDKSLKIEGLEEDLIERYIEDIPKAIYDSISPHCIPNITTEIIDGKTVVKIEVYPSQRKPYFIKAEGTPKGVYLRIGAHTKRVSSELYEDLMRQGNREYWDEQQSNISFEECDSVLIHSYYKGDPDQNNLLSDKVIGHARIGGGITLTHGGVVYFHPRPTSLFPQCEILYSEFDGKVKSHPVKTVDITGPLPVQVRSVLEILKPKISEIEKVEGAIRKTVEWKVPEVALREAIVNALIHRNYCLTSTIKIASFPDRIEIFSPGNFPGFIDLSKLGNGVSYSRNPHIQQLARKAGLVEKRGLGFKVMLEECQRNGNPRPLIEESDHHVKVTFYLSKKEHIQLPIEYHAFESAYKSRVPLQTLQAKELLNSSINTARNRLQSLVKLGFLELRGKGRAATYYWKH